MRPHRQSVHVLLMAYLSESTVSVKTGKSRPGEKKRRKIMPSEKERCKGRNDLEIRRGHVDEVHRMNRQARLRRTDKDLGNTARKEASRHPISSASRIGHRTKGGRLPTSSSTSRPRDDDAATTASLEEPDGPESQDQAKEIDPTLARARTVRHSPTILAESSPTPKMSRYFSQPWNMARRFSVDRISLPGLHRYAIPHRRRH